MTTSRDDLGNAIRAAADTLLRCAALLPPTEGDQLQAALDEILEVMERMTDRGLEVLALLRQARVNTARAIELAREWRERATP